MSALLWTQPEWLNQAQSWIESALAQHGIQTYGAVEQPHIRPWSTVLRVPTRSGDYFFKASAKALRHEAALTQKLSHWQPRSTPRVLAADVERGWLLLADGGTRLRDLLRSEADLRLWEMILPSYAELQIECAHRQDQLWATGLPDRRLANLPALLEDVLNDTEIVQVNLPGGLTKDEHRRLQAHVDRFTQLCDQLSTHAVPDSLDHGDLHDGNIFVRDGSHVVFDWGDSSMTHPFFSLRTTFVSLENTFGLGRDSPWFERLMACYLEPWTAYRGLRELAAATSLAQQLAPLVAALRWRAALSTLDEPPRPDYAAAIQAC
jgi:hypothetical protein